MTFWIFFKVVKALDFIFLLKIKKPQNNPFHNLVGLWDPLCDPIDYSYKALWQQQNPEKRQLFYIKLELESEWIIFSNKVMPPR